MKLLFRVGSFFQRLSRKNIEALKDLQRRAERGEPDAQVEWGEKHYEGIEGFARNVPEAAKWFRKAAEQGHPKAQMNLGMMYFLGRGVRQDRAEAYKWIQLAAEQHHKQAEKTLGTLTKKLSGSEIEAGKERVATFNPVRTHYDS